jgi:hypothetical protein
VHYSLALATHSDLEETGPMALSPWENMFDLTHLVRQPSYGVGSGYGSGVGSVSGVSGVVSSVVVSSAGVVSLPGRATILQVW